MTFCRRPIMLLFQVSACTNLSNVSRDLALPHTLSSPFCLYIHTATHTHTHTHYLCNGSGHHVLMICQPTVFWWQILHTSFYSSNNTHNALRLSTCTLFVLATWTTYVLVHHPLLTSFFLTVKFISLPLLSSSRRAGAAVWLTAAVMCKALWTSDI